MPGFFNRLRTCLPNRLQSTTGSRNTIRGNAIAQVLGSSLETITPAAGIPTKLVQSIASLYSSVVLDPTMEERLAHAALFLVAATQFGIYTTLFFQGETCGAMEIVTTTVSAVSNNTVTSVNTAATSSICDASFYLGLLYAGGLTVVGLASEMSKQAYQPEPPAPVVAV